MDDLKQGYLTAAEAAKILAINPKSAGFLARRGKLPAVKMANRWLIPRKALEEFARTYVPRSGHPRMKRKYTKRSAKWSQK